MNGEGRPEYCDRARAADRDRLVAARLHPGQRAETRAQLLDRRGRSNSRSTTPGSNPGASAASCATTATRCGSRCGRSPAPRTLVVVFRVFDDGVGFRYEFPGAGCSLTQVDIVDELTEFAVAEPATAWWIPGGEWNRYEYLYNQTPLTELAQAHTPVTLKTGERRAHCDPRSSARRLLPACGCAALSGQRLKAVLSPSSTGPRCAASAPFATPWRTLQIARRRAGPVHVRPHPQPQRAEQARRRVVGQAVQICRDLVGHAPRHATWGSGPKHGATTAETQRYIDFAAANGFRGVLVEGWNKGWDGDWFASGDDFSFTEAYPDFDLAALAAYAKKKGVRLVGHHETAGNIAVYEKQFGPALDLYEKLGIDAVKTGYVADAGGVQALGDGRTASTSSGTTARCSRAITCSWSTEAAQAAYRHERARAHQGHRPAPHLSELGGARRRARHGIQRLGRSAESARARGESRLHAHAGGTDGFHARRAEPHRRRRQAHPVAPSPNNSRCTWCSTARSRWRRICRRTTRSIRSRSSSSRTCPSTGATRACSMAKWATTSPSRARTATAKTGISAPSPTKQPRTLRVSLDFLDDGSKYHATIYRDGRERGLRRRRAFTRYRDSAGFALRHARR